MIKTVLINFILLAILNLNAQYFKYLSPTAIEIDTYSNAIFVAGKTGNEIRAYNLNDFASIKSLKTELNPTAIAITDDDILITASFSERKQVFANKKKLKQEAVI